MKKERETLKGEKYFLILKIDLLNERIAPDNIAKKPIIRRERGTWK